MKTKKRWVNWRGNGGKGRREDGEAGRHGETRDFKRGKAFAWTNDGNYLENRVFGWRDLRGVRPVVLSFPKTRNCLVCSVFLEGVESECMRRFVCVKVWVARVWRRVVVRAKWLYLFFVGELSGWEESESPLRSAPPFPLGFYALIWFIGRTLRPSLRNQKKI